MTPPERWPQLRTPNSHRPHRLYFVGAGFYSPEVARQVVRSSEAALAGRQREVTFRAATAYFDLARARAVIAAEEASRIAGQHVEQTGVTTEAGFTVSAGKRCECGAGRLAGRG